MATVAAKANGMTRALVLLLGAAVFLNYVDRGAVGIAAPLMQGDLGLSATQFGLVASAFFWIYGPVQLVVGWLCDRFNVYRLMTIGLLLWAAATLLMGFVGGFLSLLVLRVMLGVGESIAFPGTSKIIAQQVPAERRGVANSAVSLGIALGPAAGTLAGGLILASWGWRPIFIVFGLVTLLWLIPWRRTVNQLPTHGSAEARQAIHVPLRALLSRWPLWSMSIAHIASNYGFYFLLIWLPNYLVKARGLDIGEMTLLATLGYVAQAVAAIGFGLWSDRWTRSGRSEGQIRRWMMIVAQIVQGLAIVGVLMAESSVGIGIWLVIAGIATGSLSLNVYAVAQMFAGPRAAGSWIGFQNAVGNSFSGILGPVITGVIVDAAGYDGAFYVAAAVAIAGGIWWLVAVPRIAQVIPTD
ncbi:MAG: MFS transporter [Pseudomonadota bacterium]|nr:MFS transporter [Pseudomonadota bacterium]